ncbi:uncharacterized protein [Pyrus communis]|uniref:uncharacterized protein n=1 Tax=Pyrus communis TaxID=23211 RepID=UPI0035C21078
MFLHSHIFVLELFRILISSLLRSKNSNVLYSGHFEDFVLVRFIVFLAIIWVLQEFTKVRVLRYVILFIGVMNSLFSVYDIYDDLISRRVNSSDAEKFAEVCPCPCNGVGWGVIWGLISFIFLSASVYLGLVILS